MKGSEKMFERLKEEMNKQDKKAFSLAKQADINPSDLYSALKGDRPMFPNWKKRIAAVLGKPESELFDDRREVK